MRLGLLLSPVIAVVLGLAPPAGAADPAPTTLAMSGQATYANTVTQLVIRVQL